MLCFRHNESTWCEISQYKKCALDFVSIPYSPTRTISKMPKGISLTTEERAVVLALFKEGVSRSRIAMEVKRSRSAISKVIREGQVRGGCRRRGPKRKLKIRVVRLIIRAAKTGEYTARELRDKYAPDVTVRRVQQVLQSDPELCWERMNVAPMLSSVHKQKRWEWAKQMVVKGGAFWRDVIFSDESRFTLDGPDGLSGYWRDVRRAGRWRGRRQRGGGGVMIWGCFSWFAKSSLVFCDNNIDSSRYCSMLNTTLLPFIDNYHIDGAVFQQDNASAHTSHYTKEWFTDMDVQVLDWPARSPDQNPIENLWSILAQDVYNKGKQYDNINDLKNAIKEAWDRIELHTLRKLADSMPRRILSLLEARGGPTRY